MSTEEKYYPRPQSGARWAIPLYGENGEVVRLIQDTACVCPEDPTRALTILGVEPTEGNLDHFFPENHQGNRCPKYDLIALCGLHKQRKLTGDSSEKVGV